MVKILDCTIRDGGYLNLWNFSHALVADCYKNISESGVDYIELGFLGSEKDFPKNKYGIYRRLNRSIIEQISSNRTVPISAMIDFGKHHFNLPPAEESLITLIRVATHKKDIRAAVDYCQVPLALGYETSIQLMNYPSYSIYETQEVVKHINDCPIDYTYIADSYGSIYPREIPGYIDRFRQLKTSLGFHPHNNLQLAFANTLSAIKYGIDIVDATVFGMGRGAGNLPLEILIGYMKKQYPHKYEDIPIIRFATKHIVEEFKKNPWGHNLFYVISGLINCHPNYVLELTQKYNKIDAENAYDALITNSNKSYVKGLI